MHWISIWVFSLSGASRFMTFAVCEAQGEAQNDSYKSSSDTDVHLPRVKLTVWPVGATAEDMCRLLYRCLTGFLRQQPLRLVESVTRSDRKSNSSLPTPLGCGKLGTARALLSTEAQRSVAI